MTKELDIVYGKTGDCSLELQLAKEINAISPEGTLYIGYPIFAFGEGQLRIAVLYSSRKYGLTVFDFNHYGHALNSVESEIIAHQEYIYSALAAKMLERPEMRLGRGLALQPQILSVHHKSSREFSDGTLVSTIDELQKHLKPVENLSDELYQHLNAFIQRSSSLRPLNNREKVQSDTSIGGILKKIEKEIANLDHAQKKAAIESCEGPQRLRGLAGTGKTIVLALKAALTHIAHPEWRLLVTFHTRSLYQQFEGLIRRFTYEYKSEEPNWDKLTIMHAWGSQGSKGVYTEVCQLLGHRPVGFKQAQSMYGRSRAFSKLCSELLRSNDANGIPGIYDAVFIDEAQDLPQPFFEIIHNFTRTPKRIIYAYDELQSLTDLKMKSPEELFGSDELGKPRVKLQNKKGFPKEDLTLDVCYRNPPWILSTALALGFGIYSQNRIVQMFDRPSGWDESGFRCVNGKIAAGKQVSLKRSEQSAPTYFENLIKPDKSLVFRSFSSREEERAWIKEQILYNLKVDEVAPDDILVVIANTLEFRDEFYEITKVLGGFDFGIHAPGAVSSHENFFEKNSIAISNIYRAKGNEAPIVYLYGADFCVSDTASHTKRNILFTALTRSRGWARVTGVGKRMETLVQEFEKIRNNDFYLNFKYPTESELKEIRTLSDDENNKRNRHREFLTKLFDKKISIDEVPTDIRDELLTNVS